MTQRAAIKEAGYELELVFAAPEDGIGGFVEKLKEGKWDGVLIGYGVRANPDLTTWFETIVNAVVEYSPKTKFAFNVSPDTSLDALTRVFPQS